MRFTLFNKILKIFTKKKKNKAEAKKSEKKAKPIKEPPISMLNDDCLINIFKHLSIKDRIVAERVCKDWNRVSKLSWSSNTSLKFDSLIWDLNYPKHSRIQNFTMILKSVLERCGRYLTDLSLDGISGQLNEQILDVIIKECPRLRSVDIGCLYATSNVIDSLRPIFDKFKKCDFIFVGKIDDRKLNDLFSTNDKLEHLEMIISPNVLDGSFLTALSKDTMRELHLYDAPSIPFEVVSEAVVQFKNLHTLAIYDSKVANGEPIKLPKSLKHLSLGHTNVDPASIVSLPSLESLEMECEKKVTDTSLVHISQNFLQLRALKLSRCSKITDDGIKSLAKLSLLETLHIKYNDYITGWSFKYFSTLKKLDFSYSRNIKSENLCDLAYNCENIREMILYRSNFLDDTNVEFLKSGMNVMRSRGVNGVPLTITSYRCIARITPTAAVEKSAKTNFNDDDDDDYSYNNVADEDQVISYKTASSGSAVCKLLFEISEVHCRSDPNVFQPIFTTYDSDKFVKKVLTMHGYNMKKRVCSIL